MTTRVAFSDHRRTTDGCWLPCRINVVGYFYDEKDSRFGDPFRCDVRRIKRLAVNEDVPESLFALEYPVGTVVRDAVRKHYYRVGENGEELKISDWS